jgi:hypothetical protein
MSACASLAKLVTPAHATRAHKNFDVFITETLSVAAISQGAALCGTPAELFVHSPYTTSHTLARSLGRLWNLEAGSWAVISVKLTGGHEPGNGATRDWFCKSQNARAI